MDTAQDKEVMTTDSHVGAYLRAFRERKSQAVHGTGRGGRLTQRDVAKRAGVSAAYIGFLESGRIDLPHNPASREKLARGYGLTSAEFEVAAKSFGQGLGRPQAKRGPKKKTEVQRGTTLAKGKPSAPSPLNDLDWAVETALKDPQFDFAPAVKDRLTTIEAQMNVVKIYEHLTNRQLLSTNNRRALEVLTQAGTPDNMILLGAEHHRELSGTNGRAFEDLLALLDEYHEADAIPKSRVVEAWISSFSFISGQAPSIGPQTKALNSHLESQIGVDETRNSQDAQP